AALALGWGGWRVIRGPIAGVASGGLDPKRVAVLYFADFSRDSSLGYLADGLTEALIDELGQVQALTVVSRNGVSPYRRRELAPDSVARALQAGTLVGGSVEQVGPRVRVSFGLIDGTSGAEYRRGSFEHPAGEALTIRDSLARQVSVFLREWLGEEVRLREERTGTRNPAAWTLVQRAEKLRKDAQVLARTDAAGAMALFERADSLLAQAEQLDDRWIVPVEQRGIVVYRLSRLHRAPGEAEPYLRTAFAHAERALARDPKNADALELRGTVRYRRLELGLDPEPERERRLAEAEADLLAATQHNPTQVGAWYILSVLYYNKRSLVDANLAARRAYDADAYLAAADQVLFRLFITSYDLEQFQQAANWCETGRRRFPQYWPLAECELLLMTTPVRPADPERAWQIAEQVTQLRAAPDREVGRLREQILAAAVLARAQLGDSARRVLDRSRGNARIDPPRELLGYQAWVYTTLGNLDRALELLREYFVASPDHRRGFRLHVHWWWRPLQDDPRFRALIAG
ncbi:MAG: hypothetical protein ACREL9_10490, partial [Gemmatimonadales bacterium]